MGTAAAVWTDVETFDKFCEAKTPAQLKRKSSAQWGNVANGKRCELDAIRHHSTGCFGFNQEADAVDAVEIVAAEATTL
jgi:hypothetical protein